MDRKVRAGTPARTKKCARRRTGALISPRNIAIFARTSPTTPTGGRGGAGLGARPTPPQNQMRHRLVVSLVVCRPRAVKWALRPGASMPAALPWAAALRRRPAAGPFAGSDPGTAARAPPFCESVGSRGRAPGR
jgi:hypothetical protein